VLSERLHATSSEERYVVALEGLSGQRYWFAIEAPDDASARSLRGESSAGTAALEPASAGRKRTVEITFPTDGANADGYTMATVTFTRTMRQ
jgi:hypothetical protein